MTVSISLDPILELPAENELDSYPGYETTELRMYARKWLQASLKTKTKTQPRKISSFGENLEGQSVLLSRFLTPQKIPPGLTENFETDEFLIEKVARYVSLIPFMEDNRMFEDMPDMWCTSQEFLDLGAGDYEEHAVLLCNYFKYIDLKKNRTNIENCIVLGKGIPEGYTTYVLRRDKNTNHCELWNSIRGEAYFFGREEVPNGVLCFKTKPGIHMNIRTYDSKCPLTSVGCVITESNVYSNI